MTPRMKYHGQDMPVVKRKRPYNAGKFPSRANLWVQVEHFCQGIWEEHGNTGQAPLWFVREAAWEEEGLIKRKWTAHLDMPSIHWYLDRIINPPEDHDHLDIATTMYRLIDAHGWKLLKQYFTLKQVKDILQKEYPSVYRDIEKDWRKH